MGWPCPGSVESFLIAPSQSRRSGQKSSLRNTVRAISPQRSFSRRRQRSENGSSHSGIIPCALLITRSSFSARRAICGIFIMGHALFTWAKTQLALRTFSAALGTLHKEWSMRKPCSICGIENQQQTCIVCERTVCDACFAPDLRPGDMVLCRECDKVTPDRTQAIRHYWLRNAVRNNAPKNDPA